MRHFKEHYGRPGIAIRGFGQAEDLERSREAGFANHLVKPIDIEPLKLALQKVV